MGRFTSPAVDGLPRFTGGAVGFLGYESALWFEPSLQGCWKRYDKTTPDDTDDAGFMLFDTILAFDHLKHRILVIANAEVGEGFDLRAQYELAQAKIRFLERELGRGLSDSSQEEGGSLEWRSNTARATYEESVAKAQRYIKAGDIYQVVLSQRFETDVSVDPFTVYRALRYVNPSPYMYFMRLGGVSIVGSSPEMLVRVEGDRAETHPIAGTRPAGRTRFGTNSWLRSSGRTRKNGPSMSCWSTSGGTTSEGSANTERCGCRSIWGSNGTRMSCISCRGSWGDSTLSMTA